MDNGNNLPSTLNFLIWKFLMKSKVPTNICLMINPLLLNTLAYGNFMEK